MQKDVFRKTEKSIGEPFPANLDRVLLSAGYDSLYTISRLDENDIKLIEEYSSRNPTRLIETEYCSNTIRPENFQLKLKPGHKKFLLGQASASNA